MHGWVVVRAGSPGQSSCEPLVIRGFSPGETGQTRRGVFPSLSCYDSKPPELHPRL